MTHGMVMRHRRRLALGAILFALTSTLGASSPALSEGTSLAITSTIIPRFDPASDDGRTGALRYIGGFRYASRDPRLEGVSAFRLRDGRSHFLSITDTGYWFSATLQRDSEGRPIGFADAEMAPILSSEGLPQTRRKGLADAEGMAIDGDRVLVSFEQKHRINAFAHAERPFDSKAEAVRQPIPLNELRTNQGIEAIAVAPAGTPGGQRTVIVSELSLDADGNLFAAILGEHGGIFKVKREEPWSVTDGAFLPGGDLLLLERRYQGFGRIGMRLRRIPGATIKPGALVDGSVLMEAGTAQEIDNMEGLDVSVAPDGTTVIALVSDDNGSFFQRNLYLEFALEGAGPS